MTEYIGIVPVTFDNDGVGKVYLFECKPWKRINEGDYVMVNGNRFARAVADSLDISVISENYAWIVQVFGAKHPLTKIDGRFVPVEFGEE